MLEILKYLAVAEIEGEATTEVAPSETPVDGTVTENSAAEVEASPINEIDIDGEKYSLDDVKSWKTSSITSKEYLDKVNQFETEKERYREAVELFEYMQGRPELVKKLYELDKEAPKVNSIDPQMSMVNDLKTEIMKMKIEKELDILKIKEPEIDDMAVLKLAVDKKVDINTAATMWKGQNMDNILKKKLKEQSKNITQEISKNKESTKSLIKNGDGIATSEDLGLSDLELMMAKKLGMEAAEYKKWKK